MNQGEAVMRRLRQVGITALLLCAGGAMSGASDDPAAKGASPYRRLPSYFGQIGLNEKQKESVYEVRGRCRAEIEALTLKIEALKERERAECEAILTDGQRRLLNATREAAGRARAARKAATGAGTPAN